jgi:hypothetical protein
VVTTGGRAEPAADLLAVFVEFLGQLVLQVVDRLLHLVEHRVALPKRTAPRKMPGSPAATATQGVTQEAAPAVLVAELQDGLSVEDLIGLSRHDSP